MDVLNLLRRHGRNSVIFALLPEHIITTSPTSKQCVGWVIYRQIGTIVFLSAIHIILTLRGKWPSFLLTPASATDAILFYVSIRSL